MRRSTREWVLKAEADYEVALATARSSKSHHDHVCFLCQQCTEKYLKALLNEAGLAVPRTHLLFDLRALALPHYPALKSIGRGMRFLTRFAVHARYPGFRSTKRQATAAMRWAERVRASARSLLGLRLRPRRP